MNAKRESASGSPTPAERPTCGVRLNVFGTDGYCVLAHGHAGSHSPWDDENENAAAGVSLGPSRERLVQCGWFKKQPDPHKTDAFYQDSSIVEHPTRDEWIRSGFEPVYVIRPQRAALGDTPDGKA